VRCYSQNKIQQQKIGWGLAQWWCSPRIQEALGPSLAPKRMQISGDAKTVQCCIPSRTFHRLLFPQRTRALSLLVSRGSARGEEETSDLQGGSLSPEQRTSNPLRPRTSIIRTANITWSELSVHWAHMGTVTSYCPLISDGNKRICPQ
jgi:hypothetical protein